MLKETLALGGGPSACDVLGCREGRSVLRPYKRLAERRCLGACRADFLLIGVSWGGGSLFLGLVIGVRALHLEFVH